MTANSNEVICSDISAHINQQGGARSSWYVGIASDVQQRLFGDHRVPKQGHWYIYREALSSHHARAIEKAFLDWGCDGGPGGGGSDTTYVYAYLKTAITMP